MKKTATFLLCIAACVAFLSAACFFVRHAGRPVVSAFVPDTPSYETCVGTAYTVLVRMDVKSRNAPAASSSDEAVAEVKLLDAEDPRGYLYEVRANGVGTADVTIENSLVSQTIPVNVSGRGPIALDTSHYRTFVGNVYCFRAETGVNDILHPRPISLNPDIAKVEFYRKEGTGKYLFRITAVSPGITLVGAGLLGSEAMFPVYVTDSALIPFEKLLQNPELPAGCEITAAANVLNHYGYDVSKTYLADHFLDRDSAILSKNGKLYAADPYRVYVGDPRTKRFGCFAQPIAKAVNKYMKSMNSRITAKNISGSEPTALYHHTANNIPVLVWATMNMSQPTYESSWYDKKTGKLIQWIGGEHCLVLIGVNSDTVTVSDPLRGIVTYSRSLFEVRYRQLTMQAVSIY